MPLKLRIFGDFIERARAASNEEWTELFDKPLKPRHVRVRLPSGVTHFDSALAPQDTTIRASYRRSLCCGPLKS